MAPSLTNVTQACPDGYQGVVRRLCWDGAWEDAVYECGRRARAL